MLYSTYYLIISLFIHSFQTGNEDQDEMITQGFVWGSVCVCVFSMHNEDTQYFYILSWTNWYPIICIYLLATEFSNF